MAAAPPREFGPSDAFALAQQFLNCRASSYPKGASRQSVDGPVQESEVLGFVSATVKSIWALELLLLMRRTAERCWTADQLVRELRASTLVVREALAGLQNSGLVAADEADLFCYRPASDHLATFVDETESLYLAKPLSVINAIAAAPNEKLRIFAEAFRLKD